MSLAPSVSPSRLCMRGAGFYLCFVSAGQFTSLVRVPGAGKIDTQDAGPVPHDTFAHDMSHTPLFLAVHVHMFSPTDGPSLPALASGTPVGSPPRKPAAVCPCPPASRDGAEGAAPVSQHGECHLVLGAARLQGHLHLRRMRMGVRVRTGLGVARGGGGGEGLRWGRG